MPAWPEGAFLAWGGQRGSALSLAIQSLGILGGAAPVIRGVGNYGLFFLVIDPEVLLPGGQYRASISELRRAIAAGRPADGTANVRVPGDGSLLRRKQALAAGIVNVDERVYQRILALCEDS